MNKRTILLKMLFMIVFIGALFMMPMNVAQASTKTDADNMLKYYKKGNITQAKKYNKRLPRNASKTSIKKLSKNAKKAYTKVVKKYKLGISFGQDYLWGYYLVDMDGDNIAELLVQHGTCEADAKTAVYTYKKGKIKKIREFYSGHEVYYAYPGHAGIICVWGHMDYERVSTKVIKKGKIVSKSYGDRDLSKGGDYFPFKQILYGHIKYDKKYNPVLDLRDLQ